MVSNEIFTVKKRVVRALHGCAQPASNDDNACGASKL